MVRTRAFWIAALLLMSSRMLSAQDLTGDWQGTLGAAPRQLRVVLHIEKTESSAWKATLASIDQTPDWGAGMPMDSIVQRWVDALRTTPIDSPLPFTLLLGSALAWAVVLACLFLWRVKWHHV